MTKLRFLTIICSLFLFVATANIQAGDASAGREKAQICLTCHQAGDGTVGPDTPIISGQYEDYLVQALKNYRSGNRANPLMASFVSTLTDDDIEDLAAFYSELESSLTTPPAK